MAIKTHLANSLEPLKEGAILNALCGTDVPDAAFVFSWEPEEFGDQLQSDLKVCRTCRKRLVDGQCLPMHSYLYGIRSGEEARRVAAGGQA